MEHPGRDSQTVEDQGDIEIITQKDQSNVKSFVTVAISLYNYKRYIISCLESVKSQTLSNMDLIVVDDCSTDGSLNVVHNWLIQNGARFNKYFLIHHTINKGLASARNDGFIYADTDYVFVLDADNLLYSSCLERLSSALENCDASFAYCYLEKFGSKTCLENKKSWNPATFRYNNSIDAMVLLRKNVWQQVGGYSKMEIMGWEDFDLWFKIARNKGWGILVHEILARYRVHRRSMLNKVTNPNVKKLWAYLQSTYLEFFFPS